MKTNLKKCKGIGVAKGYGCGKLVLHRRYGLGFECKCYGNWLFNSESGELVIQKTKIQAKKKVERESKKEMRDEKEQIINYKGKLQSKINEIARLIDVGLPCLAKQVHSPQMHGGHVFSVGSNQTARFNLHNIHRQGAQSNHFQNDDGLMKSGLVREYGQEYFNFVEGFKAIPTLNLTHDDFKAKYKLACSIANNLRKEGKTFDLRMRVEKRNELNLSLGIYKKQYCEFKINGNENNKTHERKSSRIAQ